MKRKSPACSQISTVNGENTNYTIKGNNVGEHFVKTHDYINYTKAIEILLTLRLRRVVEVASTIRDSTTRYPGDEEGRLNGDVLIQYERLKRDDRCGLKTMVSCESVIRDEELEDGTDVLVCWFVTEKGRG